ncbi:MAG TPA: preprotein translocase subunit SecA, partial [Luteolibacter sp.]
MIKWILQKIVGSKNQRELRRIRPTVSRINEIEEALQREPEEKLRELTRKWQAHLSRFHALEAAPRPQLERMDAEGLQQQAAYLQDRLDRLRSDYPSLPSKVDASVDS